MPGSTPVHEVFSVGTSSVQIAPQRPSRRSMLIFNDSVEPLYLQLVVAASTAEFWTKIPAGWQGRMPWGEVVTTAVYAIRANDDPGSTVQVTELIH